MATVYVLNEYLPLGEPIIVANLGLVPNGGTLEVDESRVANYESMYGKFPEGGHLEVRIPSVAQKRAEFVASKQGDHPVALSTAEIRAAGDTPVNQGGQ